MPWILGALADAYGKAGRPEEGCVLLGDAMASVGRTMQHFWEAEVYRLQGACLLALPDANPAEADTCFQQALAIARRQGVKPWELRAAMSLSRLWQRQGKRAAARELLAPVYGWFTEGFDTPDLQEAKALLDELA